MANGFIIPDNLKLKLGKYPNDGTGDDLLTAFTKVNGTFDLINATFATGVGGENLGSGTAIFASYTDNKLKFKTLTGSSGISLTANATTINIASVVEVATDTSPTLGGSLSLNGYNVIGAGSPGASGDVRATVWGFDVRTLNNQIQTALNANFGDFGTFTAPTTSTFDLGTF
jgi:hypothetical protein